jgi:hypothetical protein
VVQSLATGLGRFNGDGKIVFNLFLANEFAQEAGPQLQLKGSIIFDWNR